LFVPAGQLVLTASLFISFVGPTGCVWCKTWASGV